MSEWNPSPVPETAAPDPGTPQPPQNGFASIFAGPHGIRAGWRFAIYLVMAVLVAVALFFILQSWHPTGAAKIWEFPTAELISFVAAAVPAVIMARIEKRPFGDYGLPIRAAFGKLFWVGAIWGLAAITLLMGILRGMHGFYFGHVVLHGPRLVKFALFWALVFLIVGLFEEFLFRGYSLFTLTTGMGFWPSAVLLSLMFGFAHKGNAGESWFGEVAAGLIGLFFCLTLRRTGNLWFAVGFHFSFDWGETFLYSVPNSGTVMPGHLLNSSFQGPQWLTGGTVGPEGSVFVFLMIAIVWAAFDRVYREVKYEPR